jgi:tripartite-type tricarboxylate transporter receptor subunit TctC
MMECLFLRGTMLKMLSVIAVAVLASEVFAQNFPVKPIRFILPYPPGGNVEVLGRPIANEMSKSLGQPVVIDYKPGGGSSIGADATAKSPPDGYTVVMLLPAHAVNATLMPNLPYDTVKDFASVTLLVTAPLVVEVNAQSPIRTLRDLINAAKASPGKLNYASTGPGNASHLAVELFKSILGIDLVHVPYKGSGPAIIALLGREVDVFFDGLGSSLPQIQAGKFRPLAVSTATRSRILPDVPTVQEAGVPGFDVYTWFGIFAPAGTPAAVIQKLNAEFVKAMRVPEVKARFEAFGYEIVGSTPAQLDALLRSEIARWGKVAKDASARID